VSLSLLLILLLGRMWRLALWTRLLWLIARLELRLVASHPDRAAGLGFVGYSLDAFSMVALAFAVVIAGRSAHTVLLDGNWPTKQLITSGLFLLTFVAFFMTLLLVFMPIMLKRWERGISKYGPHAARVGTAFEEKWLRPDGRGNKVMLDEAEFSTTAGFYAIVANVHALKFAPIELISLLGFIGAGLSPFIPIPVLFLALHAEQILAAVKSLLF
jgi:hypothetical protein